MLDATTLAPVGGDPVLVGALLRPHALCHARRPHGGVVVSSTDHAETKVLLVDLEARRIVRSTPVEALDRAEEPARNNTVAPDGRTVGVGGNFGDVVVVDAVTGEVSPLLDAHDDFVESVTFAPDLATFVTTGRDGAVKLWDTETQRPPRLRPARWGRTIASGRRSSTPTRLLIVYDTGEIFEWDPRPDAWEAHACRVAGRNLTRAEWADLFPGERYRRTCPQYPAGT